MSQHGRQPRLIGDPMPFRHGQWFGGGQGLLTKREFAKVIEILNEMPTRRYISSNDEDEWVAFVSLLRGGYIRESHPGSGQHTLTDKGARYHKQLGEVR